MEGGPELGVFATSNAEAPGSGKAAGGAGGGGISCRAGETGLYPGDNRKMSELCNRTRT